MTFFYIHCNSFYYYYYYYYYIYIFLYYLFRNTMYDCKAPMSRFYYPDTRRIINAFIIIIINIIIKYTVKLCSYLLLLYVI